MKRFIRRYSICIALISAAVIASASTVTFAYVHMQQQVKQQQRKAASDEKLLDTAIAHAKQKAGKAKKVKTQTNVASKPSTPPSPPVTDAPTVNIHANPNSIEVVVNKKHPLQPKNYTPSTVGVSCAGYGTATISTDAQVDFTALCNAAAKAHEPLGVSSSYRSYTDQVSTYNYWVSVSGKSGADTYSARPGYSEHQTGLAIDFRVPGGAELSDFTGSKQQKWLAKNAWKYGFIQRYTTTNTAQTGYEAESWHYRYIGRSAAAQYTSSGASSLESFWGVSGGDYQ